MITSLPDGDSPDRIEEETVCRDACAVAFIGKHSYGQNLAMTYALRRGCRYCENTIYLFSFSFSLFAQGSLDCLNSAVVFHGYVPLP